MISGTRGGARRDLVCGMYLQSSAVLCIQSYPVFRWPLVHLFEKQYRTESFCNWRMGS